MAEEEDNINSKIESATCSMKHLLQDQLEEEEEEEEYYNNNNNKAPASALILAPEPAPMDPCKTTFREYMDSEYDRIFPSGEPELVLASMDSRSISYQEFMWNTEVARFKTDDARLFHEGYKAKMEQRARRQQELFFPRAKQANYT